MYLIDRQDTVILVVTLASGQRAALLNLLLVLFLFLGHGI